jgi:hypothetical protein
MTMSVMMIKTLVIMAVSLFLNHQFSSACTQISNRRYKWEYRSWREIALVFVTYREQVTGLLLVSFKESFF